MIIRFHFLLSFKLPGRLKLKQSIARLAKKENKDFESLDFIFCSDDYLQNINQSYLNHDDLTDIITFDLSDKGQPAKGEIFISVTRVKENSELYSVPFQDEMNRVIYHGVLHLCGYKDK